MNRDSAACGLLPCFRTLGRIAPRDGAGNTVFYYFSNHLGSANVVTDAAGTIKDESDYYPFGRERIVGGSDPNLYKFTGKERDVETGLYYFGARYYHENGWFMSPDEFTGGRVAHPPRTGTAPEGAPLLCAAKGGMEIEPCSAFGTDSVRVAAWARCRANPPLCPRG